MVSAGLPQDTIYIPGTLKHDRAIEHDPTRYADPDSFNPERFLNDEGQLRSDYETSSFGFGRRGNADFSHIPIASSVSLT